MSLAEPVLRTVKTPALEVAYDETGDSSNASTEPPIILLHGYPYSIRQYDAVRSLLLSKPQNETQPRRIIVPYLRGFGATRYLDSSIQRSGQQAAVAQDLLDFLDALSISSALLVGFDWGGRAACIVSALHPSRVVGLVSCQGYAIQDIALNAATPPTPDKAYGLWYQHFFNTPMGVKVLEDVQLRKDLGKMLWKQWSPNWRFTDEEFAETAKAFENEDFVPTVVHSYRHRWANMEGIEALNVIEAQLAKKPVISVPTIILAGESDGVEPPSVDNDASQRQFTGFYERRILHSIGHCPPAEAPGDVVAAIETLLSLND